MVETTLRGRILREKGKMGSEVEKATKAPANNSDK